MDVFKNYAYYYNAFYRGKDYKAEAKQVDVLLKKYGSDIHTIINYGCGTGRHDIELAKMGYQCRGVDISPSMIHIARENADKEHVNVEFSVADIRKFETEQEFDAVISLFHVMSYQNENQDILDAFRSAKSVLKPNGILLFDVWYGPGVLSDKPCVRVKEIEDDQYKLVRIARPSMYDKKNLVDVDYEVFVFDKETKETKTIHEIHNMRYFFRPELEFLLHEAGFELIDNLDCLTLGETDFNTWTSYFVARLQER